MPFPDFGMSLSLSDILRTFACGIMKMVRNTSSLREMNFLATWVVLLLGLGARYLLRWRRFSTLLLLCVLVIDLLLLYVTILDLQAGTVADFTHALAAIYLGFTVAFGHVTIRWMDQRFADGPPPWQPPSHGWAYALYEWKLWGRALLAYVLACALLFAAIYFVDQPEQTEALEAWIPGLSISLLIWLIFDPLWSSVFIKKEEN